MSANLKKKPPNPNGNPNFKAKWSAKTVPIRVPEFLADTLTSLAKEVDSGKVTLGQLNQLCLDNEAIAEELDKIAGKPSLTVVPDPVERGDELLEKLEQFESAQRAAWGTNPNQRGEFKTTSRSWDKFHEFKAWIKENN